LWARRGGEKLNKKGWGKTSGKRPEPPSTIKAGKKKKKGGQKTIASTKGVKSPKNRETVNGGGREAGGGIEGKTGRDWDERRKTKTVQREGYFGG